MNVKASSKSVAIVGGGIIGLSSALALAEAGAAVTVFDAGPDQVGASFAAAGMLAPTFEAAGPEETHPDLYDLCRQGVSEWAPFVDRLSGLAETPIDFRTFSTLVSASNEAELAHLETLAKNCLDHGISHQKLSQEEVRGFEPQLADVLAGLVLPDDLAVDPHTLFEPLQRALVQCGVVLRLSHRVADISQTPEGWMLGNDRFDAVLVTVGRQADESGIKVKTLTGPVPSDIWPKIAPVRGQALALAPSETTPRHVIRYGSQYIVPHRNRTIIGATVEWNQTTTHVSDEAVAKLRDGAIRIAPGLAGDEIVSCWAGIRPGSPDHAPVLGELNLPGLFVANGHYRNGILLAPLTGKWMADLILGDNPNPLLARFHPDRFSKAIPVDA